MAQLELPPGTVLEVELVEELEGEVGNQQKTCFSCCLNSVANKKFPAPLNLKIPT